MAYVNANLVRFLERYNACPDSLEWAEGRPFDKTSWDAAPRGEWLLWIAAKIGVEHKLLARVALEIAKSGMAQIPFQGSRSCAALEILERWLDGHATDDELQVARENATEALKTVWVIKHNARDAAIAVKLAVYVATEPRPNFLAAYLCDLAWRVTMIYHYGIERYDRDSCSEWYADLVRSKISWEAVEAALEKNS